MIILVKSIIFGSIALFFFPFVLESETLIPVGLDEFDLLYETFERKETQSFSVFDFQLAPYLSTKNSFDFSPLSFLTNDHRNKMNLFLLGKEKLSYEKDRRPKAFESIRGGITLSPFKHIFIYSNFSFDQEKEKGSSYAGRKWRGLAGSVEQSFVMYHSNKIDFMFGRFKSFWGIRKSLVLSSSNALDGFSYTIRWRKLVFSYRMAKLNHIKNNSSTDPFENRYFAGHRLDYHINKRLRIGLFETVIFGGVDRSLEFNYLNPILFFYYEQINDDVDDNTFLGFDVTYLPIKGLKLYSQLLVDDFQPERKPKEIRNHPNLELLLVDISQNLEVLTIFALNMYGWQIEHITNLMNVIDILIRILLLLFMTIMILIS